VPQPQGVAAADAVNAIVARARTERMLAVIGGVVGGWFVRLDNKAERMSSRWSVGSTNDWKLWVVFGTRDLVRVTMIFWGPELCYLFFSRGSAQA
jgi:hypothetical protein